MAARTSRARPRARPQRGPGTGRQPPAPPPRRAGGSWSARGRASLRTRPSSPRRQLLRQHTQPGPRRAPPRPMCHPRSRQARRCARGQRAQSARPQASRQLPPGPSPSALRTRSPPLKWRSPARSAPRPGPPRCARMPPASLTTLWPATLPRRGAPPHQRPPQRPCTGPGTDRSRMRTRSGPGAPRVAGSPACPPARTGGRAPRRLPRGAARLPAGSAGHPGEAPTQRRSFRSRSG